MNGTTGSVFNHRRCAYFLFVLSSPEFLLETQKGYHLGYGGFYPLDQISWKVIIFQYINALWI